jgi:hypothetical protein
MAAFVPQVVVGGAAGLAAASVLPCRALFVPVEDEPARTDDDLDDDAVDRGATPGRADG